MAHELSAGSVFAGYRIERMLGAGGMGTVYLARNPDLPRSGALKVLAAELSRDLDFRARFVREADVAAGLDHPNIVAVHQRGQFEGRLWIAMQFVDGGNAEDALRAATMTTARAVYVIGEVAKALDYAHQQGVIHRDIKPANFLLSRAAGGDERVLLSDFGIARALGDTGLTSTGSVLATLAYAAPEVLAGQGFDGRADLYSLGCALFRLLTGEAPFAAGAGAAVAVVAGHLHQPPPTVSDRVPGLSAAMDAVIATAMAKDPMRRFTSAGEFAHAAAAALYGGATDGWVPPRAARHIARRRARFAVVAASGRVSDRVGHAARSRLAARPAAAAETTAPLPSGRGGGGGRDGGGRRGRHRGDHDIAPTADRDAAKRCSPFSHLVQHNTTATTDRDKVAPTRVVAAP